jgi:hypothetical protein
MGTENESAGPSSVDMELHDLKRMEDLEARSRTCGHVVMLLCERRVRRGRRDVCVRRSVKSQYALFVSVWVGDVGDFVAECGEEGVVLAGEVGVECGCDGVGQRDGGEYGGTWCLRHAGPGLGI